MRIQELADGSAAAARTLAAGSGSSLPSRRFLLATFAFAAISWWTAAAAWSAGQRGLALAALLGGFSLGPCLTAYAAAPRAAKPLLRRLVLISGGLSMLSPALVDGTRLDLEGFFALLFVGACGAAIGPTLVTVILGPLVLPGECSRICPMEIRRDRPNPWPAPEEPATARTAAARDC